MSQNYIRSKKTMDTGSVLAKQRKKRSVNVDFSRQLSEMQEFSEESCYQDMILENPMFFGSKKRYYTRKYIPLQKSLKDISKSEKNIPTTIIDGNTLNK